MTIIEEKNKNNIGILIMGSPKFNHKSKAKVAYNGILSATLQLHEKYFKNRLSVPAHNYK